MFPTEELIDKLKQIDLSLDDKVYSNEHAIKDLRLAVHSLTQALISYHEWKQKPFMDAHTKDK